MKKLVFALSAIFLFSNFALAEPTCDTKAAEKKLAGAAKNSFLKKCEREAQAAAVQTACDAKAAEKNLRGAAKNSFTKKCVADASK